MGSPHNAYIRGIRTCIWMLKSMTDLDDHSIIAYRRGLRPQDNAVLRVLRQVLARGDSRELEGFCAALTEMVIDADESGDYIRNLAEDADRRERVMERWAKRRRG